MNFTTTIYKPRLEEAQEYQDYIARQLWFEGIALVNLQSKNGQISVGENLLGLEIKFDRKFSQTGNLFIETAERSDPSHADFVPSGIFRADNSWLYGIGNYEEFFLFSKRHLRELRSTRRILENDTKTGRGFLLPRVEAAECAERMFFWPARRPDGSFVE